MSGMGEWREVIRLHKQGKPLSAIARMTGETEEDVRAVVIEAWEDDLDMGEREPRGSAYRAGGRAGRTAR